jgi:hypothetical protein
MLSSMYYIALFIIALICYNTKTRSMIYRHVPTSLDERGQTTFIGMLVNALLLIILFAAYDLILSGKIDFAGVKI